MKHRITYRVTNGGSHVHLTVWVNGACAGTLTFRMEEHEVLDTIVAALEVECGASGRKEP